MEQLHSPLRPRESASGRIEGGSCEDLYGWTADEAIGHKCFDLLGDCAPAAKRSQQFGRHGPTWKGELQHRTKDGRSIVVFARSVLHERGHGQPPVQLLSLSDITEQQSAHAALLERDAHLLQLQSELLEPDAKLVLADRVQIQQVIVNLVRNAAEAMQSNSAQDRSRVITISSRRHSDPFAAISVADTGLDCRRECRNQSLRLLNQARSPEWE